MSYLIYIKSSYKYAGMKNKNGTNVWIAVFKDDGSTYIPEDFNDDIEKIKEICHIISDTNIDDASEEAWRKYKDKIKEYRIDTFNSFMGLTKRVLKSWIIEGYDFGATCIECNKYNEYAQSKDNYICTSCKSYKEMYC